MFRPELAMTQSANEIFVAAGYAQAYGDISLVYGEAGVGKTVALKEFAKDKNDVIYIELRDCDKSTKGVCERVLRNIGKSQRGTDRTLIDTITSYLAENPKLLIIDEAQHLLIKAIENLRAINDTTETGIVLCGNPTVYDRMHGRGQAHFAQLYSRIGIRRCIDQPSLADIQAIFSPYETDADCIRFLHKLSLQMGGIRNSIKIYNMGLNIARQSKEPLSTDHLQAAYDLRNGKQ